MHRYSPWGAAMLVAAAATCAASGGTNDLCLTAQPISGSGTFPFDNTLAATDGPADPACDFFGETQIDHDLWYCWTADCDADVTVSTCGLTGVDTKVAVYDGCVCPPGPPIVCNDDACSLQSAVTFSAFAGQSFLFRVGTFPGAAGGPGAFLVTAECPPPAPIIAGLDVTQLSYPTRPFSDYGQLHLTLDNPPGSDQIFWCNANINGDYAIQNAPVIPIDGPGLQTYVLDFRIADVSGIPVVDDAQVQIQITELQLSSVDPITPIVSVPVTEHVYVPGIGVAEPNPTPLPATIEPAINLVNPPLPATWQRVRLRNVPGISEADAHCTPGGFARVLDWLTHFWCIMLPDNNDDVQEFYDKLRNSQHMMTSTASGTRWWARAAGDAVTCDNADWGKMKQGLDKFLMDKGLQNKLSIQCNMFKTQDVADPAFNPCDVFNALDQGKAVVVQWGDWPNDTTVDNSQRELGHTLSAVGAVKCGETVILYYRDDCNGSDRQGDGAADSGVKVAKFEPGGTTGWKIQGKRWEGFIAICPSFDVMIDAIVKYLTETGDDNDQVEQDLNDGVPPDAKLLQEIVDLACNVEDGACRLLARVLALEPPNPDALQLAQRLKQKALVIKGLALFLQEKQSQNTIDQLRAQIEQSLEQLGQLGALLVPPCPGDTNGDGVVDVNDLNNVILDWGTDGSAHGGDLTGPVPGSPPDGIVDVNDLNAVIVGWGDCP